MPLFRTEPHGEHEVALVEDAPNPEERIYEVKHSHEERGALSLLGSEIASLCRWWEGERQRPSQSPDDK